MSSDGNNGSQARSDRPTDAPASLVELANYRMPFGKYQGRYLVDLPEPYVVWFSQNGYPKGRLGMMLQAVYEIKLNGLEHLLLPLRGLSPEEADDTSPPSGGRTQ